MDARNLKAQILTAYYEAAGLYGPLVLVRVPIAEGEEVRAFSAEDGRLFSTLEEAQQEGLQMVELLREEFAVEAEMGGTVTPEARPVLIRGTIHELVTGLSPEEEQEIQDHRVWRERMDQYQRDTDAILQRFDQGMLELEASLAQTEAAR